MNKIFNLLVFPGGTEVGMEIYHSLVNCKYVRLFSASSNVANHAPYIYKDHFIISDIKSDKWLNELNEIILKEKIDFIFPAHSFVIDALAENRALLKAPLMLCDNSILSVTRSKKKTYELYRNEIPTPHIFENYSEVKELPVFVKPDNFYGSQGAEKIDNYEYLKEFFNKDKNYIVCEYLNGEEYTVDCFSDRNSKIIFCEGRTRERIRMGTTMHSEKVCRQMDDYFLQTAKLISEKLNIVGPWFFQMKKDSNDVLKLLEIEPRIAGTMAFHRVKGINFPLLYLYTFLKYQVNTLTNEFEYTIDRALVNRYSNNLNYDTVYIDLDDTIVVHDRINLEIIKFLFQCINRKKKIVLISKALHKNKNEYLADRKLHGLFDQVIWLSEDDSKTKYIDLKSNPIFIDDSFSQRADVAAKLNIPTFDPSMIEILLDDRV